MRFITLLLLLTLQACSTVSTKVPDTSQTTVSTSPDINPIKSSELGTVTFTPDKYATTAEKAKIIDAERILDKTLHSQCFIDFISNRKLIQTNGNTPSEVAKHLTSLSGEIPVHMYYKRFTSAVAYRQPPSNDIYLNRRYFSPTMHSCEWANTLGHEGVAHALGNYDHDFQYSPSRDFSVPYSLGFAIDACCDKSK